MKRMMSQISDENESRSLQHMKDIPQEDENVKILAILNSIILREYGLWTKAINSVPQDFPGILKTSSAMEICTEVAKRLGLKVIEAI